jgi:hypothetical protein
MTTSLKGGPPATPWFIIHIGTSIYVERTFLQMAIARQSRPVANVG